MISGVQKLLSLPAYTTITAQSFSQDGQYLAICNDQGRIAIFNVPQIIDKDTKSQAFYHFEAASILDGQIKGRKGCINASKTLKDTLILAISRPSHQEPAILAFSWKDLIQQRTKLLWSIDLSSGLLPKDVNAIDINEIDEKLFVVGGVGTAQQATKDFAVRQIDLETRMEASKPMMGKFSKL